MAEGQHHYSGVSDRGDTASLTSMTPEQLAQTLTATFPRPIITAILSDTFYRALEAGDQMGANTVLEANYILHPDQTSA